MRLLKGIVSQSGVDPDAFIFTVDTTKAGSASDTFILRCGNTGVYNATIDWGDDTTSEITTYNDADLTHVYAAGGVKTITVTGTLPWINVSNFGDRYKWTTIEQWGDVGTLSMQRTFYGCRNMTVNATDHLVLPSDCFEMFKDCRLLNSLLDFDTSNVTRMDGMFRDCFEFNQSLDVFDTSNVEQMDDMFNQAIKFNQSVSHFNTAKVTDMAGMFYSAFAFKQPIPFDLSLLGANKMTNFLVSGDLDATGTANYDATLNAWAAQLPLNAQNPNMGSSTYSAAASVARAALVSAGWTITDGGLV